MKKVISIIMFGCLIMMMGCLPELSDINFPEPGPSEKPKKPVLTDPITPSPVKPEPENPFSMDYHHINNRSFGTAIVLCPDEPKFDACVLGDYQMSYHGVDDCGGRCEPRHLYVVYNKQGLTGVITCIRGMDTVAYEIPEGTDGMLWGECSGRM